jgi:hypothetical protein
VKRFVAALGPFFSQADNTLASKSEGFWYCRGQMNQAQTLGSEAAHETFSAVDRLRLEAEIRQKLAS